MIKNLYETNEKKDWNHNHLFQILISIIQNMKRQEAIILISKFQFGYIVFRTYGLYILG